MLSPGNHKLGGHLIWGFGLPSGTAEVCVGVTPTCRANCYAVRTEGYRRTAAARYRDNLLRSRRRDFVRRVRAVLVAHAVRVVRIHTGGDFYSPAYTRKWFRIIRSSPRTRFFLYTRSWRVPGIKAVIDRLAGLPNCRVWYSTDRDTGVPADVPPRVRVAWLMTEPTDSPPPGTDLVFRVRKLRNHAEPTPGPCICPAEDGIPRTRPVKCDRCGYCWRPTPTRRVPLPVIEPGP